MPAADVAVRIAKALDTTVEYLVDGDIDSSDSEESAPKFQTQHLVRIFNKLSDRDRHLLVTFAETMDTEVL